MLAERRLVCSGSHRLAKAKNGTQLPLFPQIRLEILNFKYNASWDGVALATMVYICQESHHSRSRSRFVFPTLGQAVAGGLKLTLMGNTSSQGHQSRLLQPHRLLELTSHQQNRKLPSPPPLYSSFLHQFSALSDITNRVSLLFCLIPLAIPLCQRLATLLLLSPSSPPLAGFTPSCLLFRFNGRHFIL